MRSRQEAVTLLQEVFKTYTTNFNSLTRPSKNQDHRIRKTITRRITKQIRTPFQNLDLGQDQDHDPLPLELVHYQEKEIKRVHQEKITLLLRIQKRSRSHMPTLLLTCQKQILWKTLYILRPIIRAVSTERKRRMTNKKDNH